MYYGAGLAGLGLFGAGDMGAGIFNELPWLRLAFLASALWTAACLGLAWEPCQRRVAEIERDHGDNLDRRRHDAELPRAAHFWYRWAGIQLFVTAIILLMAALAAALC